MSFEVIAETHKGPKAYKQASNYTLAGIVLSKPHHNQTSPPEIYVDEFPELVDVEEEEIFRQIILQNAYYPHQRTDQQILKNGESAMFLGYSSVDLGKWKLAVHASATNQLEFAVDSQKLINPY
ncbi:10103_t:CDS:2 [Funneliformis caledonium]|uniref:10103_t:CDS:1 n=1 Tax=Funneliformis caledonium TaxID=1117310 RepID=A0A9N9F8T0_9GLOM|nr:10103_t:CDS:2 [Funneliformis caledonium]